jgi:WD40 repeat protein
MHIFLSYGHDEYASLAGRIKRDLQARGHEVWFDLDRLKPGGDWEHYIEEGLDWASASPGEGRFVLLMSPHSVRRPDGYCLNELARAWDRSLPIIPIMVVKTEPPLSISRIQYLDMRDCVPVEGRQEKYESKFDQLLQAIEHNHLDFEGVQARLLNYLDPLPYEAEVSQHLVRFTGRDWVERDLERWLADPKRRVFWITGEAGVGKSALAAWLSARRPEIAAFHACRYGNSDRINPRKALTSLAYQLSTQLPDYQQRLNSLNLDALKGEANARALFERLFVDPLGGDLAAPDRPLVILIDALDEATDKGRNDLASIIGTELSRTPPWLRLIVTSRPHEEAVTRPLQGLDPWRLEAGREENLRDIRSYLRRELRPFGADGEPSPATVKRIVDKSEGLFLYVSWVRQELADGRLALSEVEKFPQGLGGIYATFFERYFPEPEKYGTIYRPILEAICAAREPLEMDYLAGLFGLDPDYAETELSRAFGSLFPISVGRIRPFHQSVRDWLTDKNRAGAYVTSVAKGHQRLADYGWKQYGNGVAEMERYSIIHLPAHLAACRRKAELGALLLDFCWLKTKLDVTDVTALVADYDRGADEPCLRLMQGALRLSAHVLATDKAQFPSQLYGRLLARSGPKLKEFREQLVKHADGFWLRLVNPALSGQGGPLLGTLLGHADAVTAVAITPDGAQAISGSADKTLKVWDLKSGRDVLTLTGHRSSVTAVTVTPDGALAISGSNDWKLRIWALKAGQVRTLSGHKGRVTAVAVTPDGTQAISGSYDKTLKVWDLKTGQEVRTLSGHEGRITTVALTPDGAQAISGSDDNTLKIWDLKTGQVVRTLSGHKRRVTAVAVMPDGAQAISGSLDRTLKVWDLKIGQEVPRLRGHRAGVRGVAVTSDGLHVISGSNDHTLRVRDFKSGEDLQTFSEHTSVVTAVAVTPDGTQAISASADRMLKVWDLKGSRKMPGVSHRTSVTAVAVTPDGALAMLASADQTLKVWDLKTGRDVRTLGLSTQRDSITAVRATPDGPQDIISVGRGWWVTAVAATPDGAQVICSIDGWMITILDLKNGHEPRFLGLPTVDTARPPGWVDVLAVTPDGTQAISGSYDSTLKVWDLKTGQVARTLRGHAGIVSAIAVTPDGTQAIFGSYDNTLKVWDLKTGQVVRTIAQPEGHIRAVAATEDGIQAISISTDYTLKLWDSRSRDSLTAFTSDAPLWPVAIAAERSVVAADTVGRVYFLTLETPMKQRRR